MIDNGKPRKKQKEKDFKFLGFARCGECGYTITAERQFKKSGLEFIYYHCTKKSKTQKCNQHRFLRQEMLAEQIKEMAQKVSLPDDWKDKYLEKIKEWEKQENQSSQLFAQNLKKELSSVKIKMDRLLDAHLEGVLELSEFQEKKNDLMERKAGIEEKLRDFERKGNHWLEPVRNWIIEANLAKNLAFSDNFSEMKNFLKKIGSNRRILDQKLYIEFQEPWNYLYFLAAEPRAAGAGEAEKGANKLWWTRPDLNR